jgi:SRSO17 transposase
VQSSTSVWQSGTGPLPKPAWKGNGRPPKLLRRDRHHAPLSAKQLAFSLPPRAWTTVTWREGTRHPLRSRFAAVRIRPAHRDYWRSQPYPEEWLLIEWPRAEAEPTKYWLSTLPAKTKLRDLVRLAKQRWIIERDYQELKQELGLGHYEGRGWRGFHHHATSGLAPCARNGITPGPSQLCARSLPEFCFGNCQVALFVELHFYNTVVLGRPASVKTRCSCKPTSGSCTMRSARAKSNGNN